MDIKFTHKLIEKPTTDKLLASAKLSLQTLIKNSREYNIKNFLKKPAKYTLALSLVTDGKYLEFTAPKADYKLLIMVAEEVNAQWKIHQFICDLDAKNMQKIDNVDKQPLEPKDLGLSTQAEIIFYEREHSYIATTRIARLEIIKQRKFKSEKNIMDIHNSITDTDENYHVIVIS